MAKEFAREMENKLCEQRDDGKPRTLQDLLLGIEQFASSKKGMMSGVALLGTAADAVIRMENSLVNTNAWAENERDRLAIRLVQLYDSDNQAHCTVECADEEALFEHKMTCKFLPLSCQNEGCPESFSAHLFEKHDARCPFKCVPCTLNCNEIVMRSAMKAHQVGSCTMRLVKCPYYDLGCVDPVCLGALHDHVFKNTDSHLKMLWVEEAKVQARVLKLEEWSIELAADDEKRRAGVKAMNTVLSNLETKHLDLEKEQTVVRQNQQKSDSRLRSLESTVKAQQQEITELNKKVTGLLKTFAQLSKQ